MNAPVARPNPHPQPVIPAAAAALWAGWGVEADGSNHSVGPALAGISTIVNALTRDAVPYRVALTPGGTAATSITTREVLVTSAALLDRHLTPDARLAVTTGMALHEAGHVRHGSDHIRAVAARWPGDPVAQRLSNILDDVRLEARLAREYPAYADCFPLTLWWVAGRFPAGRIAALPRTADEATNLVVAAVRYARYVSIAAPVQGEARWWVEWADRYTRTDRPRDLIAGVEAGLARIAALVAAAPQQPQQPGASGQPGAPKPKRHPFRAAAAFAAPADEALCADCGLPQSDPCHGTDEDGDQPSAPGASSPSDEDGEDDADQQPGAGAGSPDEDGGDAADQQPGDEAADEDHDLASGTGWSGTPDPSDVQDRPLADVPGEDPVDALHEALPLHGVDAATSGERMTDAITGSNLNVTDVNVADEVVTGTLAGVPFKVRVTPLTHGKSGTVETDREAVGALRGAFTSRRTAHDARGVARSGRLSGTRAYRVRAGYADVFTRRETVSPDRLDVHLLLDLSGSMTAGSRYRGGSDTLSRAITAGATLVEALSTIPTVRVRVWGHTTYGSGTIVYDALDTREPGRNNPGRLAGFRAVSHSGNNDGQAIAAVAAIAKRERARTERTVILVLSDGQPCDPESWVQAAAGDARRNGALVISVALANGLSEMQNALYGVQNVVEYTGDWDALARDVARVIGAA